VKAREGFGGHRERTRRLKPIKERGRGEKYSALERKLEDNFLEEIAVTDI